MHLEQPSTGCRGNICAVTPGPMCVARLVGTIGWSGGQNGMPSWLFAQEEKGLLGAVGVAGVCGIQLPNGGSVSHKVAGPGGKRFDGETPTPSKGMNGKPGVRGWLHCNEVYGRSGGRWVGGTADRICMGNMNDGWGFLQDGIVSETNLKNCCIWISQWHAPSWVWFQLCQCLFAGTAKCDCDVQVVINPILQC